ncbi:hypothetical protein AN9161.2 [Aspergillus nidulans FGSC A4]|uniref:FAD-binding domain-containing protein n=1 Tax=Emericella nidulans (strain FGSC A4 / ATCC 38163 / CBS 112.46 / NRRL 194 / M139) TaxID=227321 RepID=Q5ARB9_EMENI|nr:hypothetical protein [Aspergillus nidulans FGSC A4]EAA61994.1 hypothetical protein AN9161.2 [Aspergillus nidulans FGSC A4]CBF82416.1 TPA: conserved hypothetical protein [Aspergillus nidulans FGSC A4]|eukprot:XP_682430.1 hypothetical protein AN9161.2 [Aspergillus nidulans FGSC A4]
MPIPVAEKQFRHESGKLKIVVVGAGLAGVGATIACLLAGHDVHLLESAKEIGEIGAGIQILPNSSRVLQHWGLEKALMKHATVPRFCNFLGWKGNLISSLDFKASEAQYPGTWYRDFHRADLHRCLVERAVELDAVLSCNTRIINVIPSEDGTTSTAIAADGRQFTGDLVIGCDGVFSKLTESLLQRPEPPLKTGDLAYRLLLDTDEMLKDPELRSFVTDPQVNYWLGPDKHAVNYVLRGGKLFNMVLLVPDDIPEDSLATTVEGNVEEMCSLFEGWDPNTIVNSCSAGMAFEDGAVLGEVLSRLPNDPFISKTSPEYLAEKRHALAVFEKCRKERTQMVVKRGNTQQYLYHLHDGPEQEDRDRKMQMVPTPEGECLAWRDPGLAPKLLGYDHIADVSEKMIHCHGENILTGAGEPQLERSYPDSS